MSLDISNLNSVSLYIANLLLGHSSHQRSTSRMNLNSDLKQIKTLRISCGLVNNKTECSLVDDLHYIKMNVNAFKQDKPKQKAKTATTVLIILLQLIHFITIQKLFVECNIIFRNILGTAAFIATAENMNLYYIILCLLCSVIGT